LRDKLISKRAELAGMREYETQLSQAIAGLVSDVQSMRENIANRSFERQMLDIQGAPLKAAYDLLAEKLEQAKIAEAEQDNLTDIKIVADAVAPDRKIAPRRSIITVAAMALALVLSASVSVARPALAALE